MIHVLSARRRKPLPIHSVKRTERETLRDHEHREMEVGYSSLGVTAHCVMAITSSYRHRRDYGHFGDRAQFIPYPFRCFHGLRQ